MKLEKCPICSTRMREQDGRMICQNCGYYQIIDKDATSPISVDSTPQWQQPAMQPGPVTNQQTYAGGQIPYQPPRGITVSASRHNNKANVSAIIGWVTFGIVFVFVVAVALFHVSSLSGEDVDASTVAAPTESTASEYESAVMEEDALPQSESFQVLVSQIFDVDFSEITMAHLNQITELDLYYDDDNRKCISCCLDDGTTINYFLNEDLYMDLADLSCFKNVSWLALEYGHLNPDDLKGMDSLACISSDMTLSELYDAVPDPQNISYIQINSTIFMNSCDGIENFPNLIFFAADCSDMQDISALSSVPGLEGLSLADCDRVSDFSPLYDLGALQHLSIESSSLKDIGFVENMPMLSALYLSDTDELMSIHALESCADSLTELSLEDTWKISDLSTLEKLTNLTQLQLTVSYENTLPSFAGLQNLEYLGIKGAGDISAVRDAGNVSYLSLDDCNCEDLTFLDSLHNLIYLDLYDMSGYHVNLEPVTRIPGLLGLDITGSTVYADAAALLSIPTLEELYMADCNIGLNTESLSPNENLRVLDMDNVTLYQLTDAGGRGWLQDEQKLTLSQHTDMFENFPGLDTLYLKGNELTDLTFLSEYGLTGLRLLDITDNYVVDLTPLTELPALEFVLCEDNPIADTAGLDDILIR